MTDILIRNIAEDDLRRIDQRAARLGISRAEFLRRTVEREAHLGSAPVAASDFDKFASLGDDDLMRDAWS